MAPFGTPNPVLENRADSSSAPMVSIDRPFRSLPSVAFLESKNLVDQSAEETPRVFAMPVASTISVGCRETGRTACSRELSAMNVRAIFANDFDATFVIVFAMAAVRWRRVEPYTSRGCRLHQIGLTVPRSRFVRPHGIVRSRG